MKTNKVTKDLKMLVGTYTSDKSKGIYRLTISADSGKIKKKELLVEVENPSFLAISKDEKNVYAVQEKESGKVFSYQWSKDKTKLIETSNSSTNGMHPCYVSLQDNSLAVGNYSSGDIAFYQLDDNGEIDSLFQTKKHKGKGLFLPRQESPHAHCVKFYKENTLYAVDLGIDEVIKYTINSNTLSEGQTVLKLTNGDGFRHLNFHPKMDVAYMTTEFTNTIIVSEINEKTGEFDEIQKISMLPENYKGESFAADIHISNDGKFLYASNRGHNSLVTYSINNKGELSLIGHVETHGIWPRNFTLSKDNRFLVVANQFGNNVVVFRRDSESGKLTYTGFQAELSTPVFVSFL